MRHRLDFLPPADPSFFVCFGHEAAIGFWAELWARDQPRPIAEFNAIDVEYRHDMPLLAMLAWLAQVGAFSASALEEALTAWRTPGRIRLSRDAKRVLRVIGALLKEAD